MTNHWYKILMSYVKVMAFISSPPLQTSVICSIVILSHSSYSFCHRSFYCQFSCTRNLPNILLRFWLWERQTSRFSILKNCFTIFAIWQEALSCIKMDHRDRRCSQRRNNILFNSCRIQHLPLVMNGLMHALENILNISMLPLRW